MLPVTYFLTAEEKKAGDVLVVPALRLRDDAVDHAGHHGILPIFVVGDHGADGLGQHVEDFFALCRKKQST